MGVYSSTYSRTAMLDDPWIRCSCDIGCGPDLRANRLRLAIWDVPEGGRMAHNGDPLQVADRWLLCSPGSRRVAGQLVTQSKRIE